MDTYDTVVELVDILQKWRDLQNESTGMNLPAIQPLDVLEMVNEEPVMLQGIVDLARNSPEAMRITKTLPPEMTDNFIATIREDWRFIPTDYHVRNADYNKLVKYFQNKRGYSQLNERQQSLLKYLTMEPDDFSVDSGMGFNYEHDAANAYNLQQQLIDKLSRDGVLTEDMVSNVFTSWDEFPEDFKFGKGLLGEVPGSTPARAQVPEQGIELQELNSVESWAKRIVDEIRMPKEEAVRAWVEKNGYSLDEEEFEELFEEVEDQMIYKVHTTTTETEPKTEPKTEEEINEAEYLEEKSDSPFSNDDLHAAIRDGTNLEAYYDSMIGDYRGKVGEAGQPLYQKKITPFDPKQAILDKNPGISDSLADQLAGPLLERYYSDIPRESLLDEIVFNDADRGMVGLDGAGNLISEPGMIKSYIEGQMQNLVLAPVFYGINEVVGQLMGETGQDIMKWGMAIGGLASGDPLGLLMIGVQEIMKSVEYAHTRDVDNDTPSQWKGNRFGYVRDQATGKWMPAYIQDIVEDPGSENNHVTLAYGEDMRFYKDDYYFADVKHKEVLATNGELTGEMYKTDQSLLTSGRFSMDSLHRRNEGKQAEFASDSYDYVNNVDFNRDWFFLPQEDIGDWMKGELDDFPMEGFYDKEGEGENKNAYTKGLSDWRRVLQLSQDNNNEYKRTINEHLAEEDRIPNDIELRRMWREQGLDTFYNSYMNSPDIDAARLKEISSDPERGGFYDNADQPENAYLIDTVIYDTLYNLIDAQKTAAESVGFNKAGSKYMDYESAYDFTTEDERGRDVSYAEQWSSHYLDPWDAPIASTADELVSQYETIDGMTDRSDAQRLYLKARSETRYWMGQLDDRGGMDTFFKYYEGGAQHPDDSRVTRWDLLPKGYREYWDTEHVETQNLLAETFDAGNPPPWSLVGETNFLPGDIEYTSSIEPGNYLYTDIDKLNQEQQDRVEGGELLWKDAFPNWVPPEADTSGWGADMIEGKLEGETPDDTRVKEGTIDDYDWDYDPDKEPASDEGDPEFFDYHAPTGDFQWGVQPDLTDSEEPLWEENLWQEDTTYDVDFDPDGGEEDRDTSGWGTDMIDDDGTWVPPQNTPSTSDAPDINQHTGHPQTDHNDGVTTEDTIRHIVETKGFSALEGALGLDMSTIYERYALGRFSWQTGTTVPEWMQPNLTDIYGGAEKYKGLIEKWEHSPDMMGRLERVESATRSPYVLNYLDDTHGELHQIFHSGLTGDDMAGITNQKMPSFAYNSAGHVVLRDDRTIQHDNNHTTNIVNFVTPSGTYQHSQMDFGVAPHPVATTHIEASSS